jgi:hypothetical protein
MTSSFDSYQQAISHCQQAYRQRDTRSARHWAEMAVAIHPHREEGWLWLAAMASPRASAAYLKQALEINPGSLRARKAMHWAIHRMRHQVVERHKPAPYPTATVPHPRQANTMAALPARRRWVRQALVTPVRIAWTMVLISLLGLLLFGATPLAQATFGISFANSDPISFAQNILQPATSTPTLTATPLPTATFTPAPTEPPIPTAPPTEIPAPTDEPGPPLPSGVENDEHWIDINLTDQTAFAYNGNELVKSFIVSTGTWQTPTVTGQYNIYVKYQYADMAGPGYYLPSVPYVMYFYEGYGLHGTYWHNNFGTPMSHGCVNFSTEDAGWVFDFVEVGTLVNIHY